MREIYLLNDEKFEGIKNLPVIKIDFYDKKINLEAFDALIFTSKNAVRAINKINKEWASKEIYSIGKGTSKEIKKYKSNLVYTAQNSYGNLFAQEIQNKLQNKKVLFLRAKVVTSKLNNLLINQNINLKEEVIYETKCKTYKEIKQPEKNSIIIFTSPSTVKCFFKIFEWDDSYSAIVIGKVTAQEMPKKIDYVTSKEQTIASCIDCVKLLS